VECRTKEGRDRGERHRSGQFAKGWKNSNEIPGRAEAEDAVRVMQELFSRFRGRPGQSEGRATRTDTVVSPATWT
jgi:hypothetical protein